MMHQTSLQYHLRIAILLTAAALVAGLPMEARAQTGGSSAGDSSRPRFMLSPLIGYNHDKMERHGERGQVEKATEDALEYGLFGIVAHPRFDVTDFLFFTEAADDTDVMGNFFHANLYGAPEDNVTWNVGGGHLYHKIEPGNQDIEVTVPMCKAGLVVRLRDLGISLNPYVGYAWERVETRHGDVDNDSYMYGISIDWRWRMLGVNAKYYFQDSRDSGDNYHNFRVRATTGITQNIGAVVRFDYMEHSVTDDTSVLFGPVFMF